MKKNALVNALLTIFMLTALSIAASATEVALYFEYPDGTSHAECVNYDGQYTAYQILEASSLNINWGTEGSGHRLCVVNDYGIANYVDDNCPENSWKVYLSTQNTWNFLTASIDGQQGCWNRRTASGQNYCGINGDVLGFTYGTGVQPLQVPDFGDVCDFGISDLDIKVDSKTSKDLWHGDDVGKDAAPGSVVKISLELTNFDPQMTDDDINDVVVTAKILDIDDGEDLEEESDEIDIDSNDDEKIDLEFEIPVLVEEDTYELVLEIEGEGRNGKRYDFTWTLFLELDKNTHELMIRNAELSPESVSCADSADLRFDVVNLGTDDEDDVSVIVSSPQLEYSFTEDNIELSEDPYDDDSTWTKYLEIELPENLASGIYPITIKARYGSKVSDEQIINLEKRECTSAERIINSDDEEIIMDDLIVHAGEEKSVLVVGSSNSATGVPVTGWVAGQGVKAVEIPADNTDWYLMFLVAGVVIALIMLIVLVMSLMK